MPIINGQYRRPQLRNTGINYHHGWFFVTFQVAQNKSELGAIVGERCVLNKLGEAVETLVSTLGQYNPEVYVDSHVVMPNHVHLLLKIDNRPENGEHHLGKIIGKLKSLASREYRLLVSEGAIPPISGSGAGRDSGLISGCGGVVPRPISGCGAGRDSGPISGCGAVAPRVSTRLWQENYWEKIVTSHEQLEKIRLYIAENPRNWTLDRFGPVTAYSRGNITLLNEPFEAFVASQEAPISGSGAVAPRPISGCGGVAPRSPVIISTFTSPQEREVLRRLIAQKRRFIAIYPGGIPETLPPQIAAAEKDGRALMLSPVPSGTGVNKQRAVWCNEYVIRRASRIWCGHITPGGTLHSILKALRPAQALDAVAGRDSSPISGCGASRDSGPISECGASRNSGLISGCGGGRDSGPISGCGGVVPRPPPPAQIH